MKTVLAELLKRIFTTKNGGFISLRKENGDWDWKATISLVVRLVFILLAGGGAYYFGLL